MPGPTIIAYVPTRQVAYYTAPRWRRTRARVPTPLAPEQRPSGARHQRAAVSRHSGPVSRVCSQRSASSCEHEGRAGEDSRRARRRRWLSGPAGSSDTARRKGASPAMSLAGRSDADGAAISLAASRIIGGAEKKGSSGQEAMNSWPKPPTRETHATAHAPRARSRRTQRARTTVVNTAATYVHGEVRGARRRGV
jgi:hypothetical protein